MFVVVVGSSVSVGTVLGVTAGLFGYAVVVAKSCVAGVVTALVIRSVSFVLVGTMVSKIVTAGVVTVNSIGS